MIRNNDRSPKYINTPENEIYVKSKLLYGSYFARQAIDKADECLLVEGYTDVVALHQAGIENVVASGGTSLTPDQLRLIKKYTSNLTIIYDGDAAGIKAAQRGMDLAFEESLQVRLVLIPGQEDPDSYVRKIGAPAFRDFINENKKDFILFQLEASMAAASGDSNRKALLVNQIAETISRINKAEDFTRQQDYIRRSSELLKIDENGLNSLVNKFIRERVGKYENKTAAKDLRETEPEKVFLDEELNELLNRDEQQERAIIRSLLEFGLRKWDEEKTVAEYLLPELEDKEMFDNKNLYTVLDLYKTWYDQKLEPTARNFLYHEDQSLGALVVSIMDFPYEVSENWKTHYEGKFRPGMSLPRRSRIHTDLSEAQKNSAPDDHESAGSRKIQKPGRTDDVHANPSSFKTNGETADGSGRHCDSKNLIKLKAQVKYGRMEVVHDKPSTVNQPVPQLSCSSGLIRQSPLFQSG